MGWKADSGLVKADSTYYTADGGPPAADATGDLEAQAATVSGTATRVITGSGSIASGDSSVAGTSTRTITGSGALEAQISSVSGTAARVIAGSGTLAANDGAVAGTALRVIVGSGSCSAQSSTVTGYDLYTPATAIFDVVAEDRDFTVDYEQRLFVVGAR